MADLMPFLKEILYLYTENLLVIVKSENLELSN